MRTRRITLGVWMLCMTAAAAAQVSYPTGPVRLVVGFPPGGPADITARLIGEQLSASMGKPVLVDNVVGAAGTIATERVAKAAADGQTLALVTEAQMTINPALYKLAHDPAKDLRPILQLAASPYVLVVSPAVPAWNVADLVGLAKAQPGALTFASAGSGSAPHLAAELFKSATGAELRHIPYKGVAPGMTDVLAGRVTMMFGPAATVLPAVREGRLRAIAVTSSTRSRHAPDTPTIAESGFPGFEVSGWLGLVAPAGTPATIVQTLRLETSKALGSNEVRARFAALGLDEMSGTPEDFGAVITAGGAKWARLIGESSIRADQ